MVRVSATVMAHPSRKDWVIPLVHKLGQDAGYQVDWVFDQISDCWDTARRAWLSFDPEATHHLVIQDDAVVCRDLIPGVAKALPLAPAESILSLYVGTRRPLAHSVERVVREAQRVKPSWIVMNGLNWGVAVVVPVPEIRAMVEWCDGQTIRGDDNRIRRYFVTQKKWPTWCPWPSLVDHRDIPSVLNHASGRRAHQFIGEDASALDVQFDQGHVTMDRVRSTRTPIRRKNTMAEGSATKKTTAAKKATKKATAKKTAAAKKAEPTPVVEADTVAVQADEVVVDTDQAVIEEPQPEHAPPAPSDAQPQADEPETRQLQASIEIETGEAQPVADGTTRPKFPKNNEPQRRTDRRTRSKRFGQHSH